MPVNPNVYTFFNSNPFNIIVDEEFEEEVENEEEVEMSQYQETTHDLEVKYLDCFGVMDETKIFLAKGFTSASNGKIDIHYSNFPNHLEKAIYDPLRFQFLIPEMGYINAGLACYYLERTHKKPSPARYRKGFRSELVELISISDKELINIQSILAFKTPLESSLLDRNKTYFFGMSLFEREYPLYSEALNDVLNYKKLSVAFNNNFCIKLDSYTNSIVLMYKQWIIGAYEATNNTWLIKTNLFIPELLKMNIPFKEVSDES